MMRSIYLKFKLDFILAKSLIRGKRIINDAVFFDIQKIIIYKTHTPQIQ